MRCIASPLLPLAFVAMCPGISGAAQSSPASDAADTLKVYTMPAVEIEAPRVERTVYEAPGILRVLGSFDLRHGKMARTLPDAMKELPGVMVQKTSQAQGSPYLRGFTGFRTLFLIDGIRLNNSVFRDGPNQYWATVDPLGLSRLEVILGPSAVLLGSDAVGGVVQATTRSWRDVSTGDVVHSRLFYRFASASQAHLAREEVGGKLGNRVGYYIGVSPKNFGDVTAGPNVGVQQKTGYDELTMDARMDWELGNAWEAAVAHQQVDINNAWRTHKTIYGVSWHGTTVGNEKKRVLDQHRELTYLQLKKVPKTSDDMSGLISISYHRQMEDQQRIRKDDRSDEQGFEVGTVGVFGEIKGPGLGGGWTAGLDFYRDRVDSYKRQYAADGSFTGESIQGPVADDATYDLFGAFLRVEHPISRVLEIHTGTRFTYARADARRVQDPATGEPITVRDSWRNLVGSVRGLYYLGQEREWTVFAGGAKAFRAPNLSDLTRFDSARSDEFEVPSPHLEPESFWTFDLGGKRLSKSWSFEAAVFYSDIKDMIVRTRTGNTVDGEYEVTKFNAGHGYVTGAECGVQLNITPQWEWSGSISKDYGEVNGDFLSRMPPLAGITGLTWRHPTRRYWIEGIVSLAEHQALLSERDRSDTQRIPPGGTPGYVVATIRGGWEVSRFLTMNAAVENVTNTDYRTHGSGQNEPGRNFIAGLTWDF